LYSQRKRFTQQSRFQKSAVGDALKQAVATIEATLKDNGEFNVLSFFKSEGMAELPTLISSSVSNAKNK
jgi:hypothetical protein